LLAILIHWTRQIKEVVTNQDDEASTENAGPLAEIEFWRLRTIDLSGIREQIQKPGVKRIQDVLEIAKSSYLQPFVKLSDLIQVTILLEIRFRFNYFIRKA
jgi:dynein heavy chain